MAVTAIASSQPCGSSKRAISIPLRQIEYSRARRREVVGHANRGNDESQFGGKLFANARDAAQQRRVRAVRDERDQTDADFDRERLDAQQIFEILFRRFGAAGARLRLNPFSPRFFIRQATVPRPPPSSRNGIFGKPGERRQRDQNSAGEQQRLRGSEDLLLKFDAEAVLGTGARNDHARPKSRSSAPESR